MGWLLACALRLFDARRRRRDLPPPLWGRAGEGGSPRAAPFRQSDIQAEPPPSLTLPRKGGGEGRAVDQT